MMPIIEHCWYLFDIIKQNIIRTISTIGVSQILSELKLLKSNMSND